MDIISFFVNIKVPVTVLHVLSVVTGMGSALISDTLFSFFSKDKRLNETEIKTLSLLKKIVHPSLIIVIISGIFIFLSNIEKYSHSTKFLAKMSILALLLINGYVLNKYIWPCLVQNEFFLKTKRSTRKIAFICSATSVISWVSVCTLGVLDKINMSYTQTMSLFIATLFVGIIISLLVERKAFKD